MYKVAQ